MAFYTVEKRPKSDGTPRYRCTVGVKEKGKYTYRENRTFTKQAIAKSWGAKRVLEIEEMGIPSKSNPNTTTLGDLIRLYLDCKDIKVGRSKEDTLNAIALRGVALTPLSELNLTRLVEYARSRRASGCSPKTVAGDISYIGVVLRSARPLFGCIARIDEYEDAKAYMSSINIIGPSNKRTRRPLREEITKIIDGLALCERKSIKNIPYVDIFNFSILSCMRVGEVCRLQWKDVSEKTQSIVVRDRKDPRKKQGNHMVVPLLGDAWEIIKKQPKKDEMIFPYHPKTISDRFRSVANALNIPDLRYHDLRREGASRLFEMGFSVEEVAQVTGHRNLNTLWTVYREIYPQTLHDRFNELQKRNKKES